MLWSNCVNRRVAPALKRHRCATGEIAEIRATKGATTMKITTLGVDLAKNVFQLHGIDEQGRVVLTKALKRTQVLPFFANLAPYWIGMEACGSAHHWARRFEKRGPMVKLMVLQFVKPYGKTNKNDANAMIVIVLNRQGDDESGINKYLIHHGSPTCRH